MAFKRKRYAKRFRRSIRRRPNRRGKYTKYRRLPSRGVRRLAKKAYRIAKGECYYHDYNSQTLTTTDTTWSTATWLTSNIGASNASVGSGPEIYAVGAERNSSLRGTQILGRYLAINFMCWTGLNQYPGYLRVIIARSNNFTSTTPSILEVMDDNSTFMTFKRVGDTKYTGKWTILRDKTFRFNNGMIRNFYWKTNIKCKHIINFEINQIDPNDNGATCGPGNIFMFYCWAGVQPEQMNGNILYKTRLRYYDP